MGGNGTQSTWNVAKVASFLQNKQASKKNIIMYSECEDEVPQDILEEANVVSLNLLPLKSREKYEKEYQLFKCWMETRQIRKICEEVVLFYFSKKCADLKPSTLWSKYSMLRSTLQIKDNIDIKFPKLVAFLKRKSAGYKAKKANTFSRGDISKFIAEAPDETYLHMKVVLIFGIAGACRSDELVNMVLEDISDKGDILVVQIPDSKTNIKRTFTITNEILNGVSILDMYRKYLDCRSPKTCHSRFFVTYVKGKCTNQVIGKNTIAKIPYRIAIFLNLDDSKGYTGHSFRRTSATLLVNAGSDILTLKRHGGWRTNAVAEGYIDDCITKKCEVASQIITGESTTSSTKKRCLVFENLVSTTSTSSTTTTLENNKPEPISTSRANISSRGISISNLTNCTINFNNI